MSLFWRLLIPNATVLGVACVVLVVEPANGRVPALVGGLTVMVVVNSLLMRRAFAPLTRLARLMQSVDPLRPGQRLQLSAPASEVTILAGAFNDMLDRLESERRDSGRRALLEREGERRRLAAELHDELGQSLTALVLRLDALGKHVPDDVRPEAEAAREAALAMVDDVRTLARRLRPEALDSLGLVPALTTLVDGVADRTGIEVERRLERALPALSPEAELVVYRVAQESLTNAMRHAGARRVEVSLRPVDGKVVLEVRDDGVGIGADAPERGGIRGMRERAMLIGADLHVTAAPGRGTQVRLEVAT